MLSVFGYAPDRPPAGRLALIDGLPHLLSAAAGAHARALCEVFELVWCTGWEERADEHLPHALGLPAGRPYLRFGRSVAGGPHWKLEAIRGFDRGAAPLAWVDDDHDASAHAWARARPGPTRLLTTDPAVGLTGEQADSLLAWARELATR